MRETMGRRLDGLSDEERDRVITAHDFNDGLSWWDYHLIPACGCLEGTIAGRYPGVELQRVVDRVVGLYEDPFGDDDEFDAVPWSASPPAIRYPKAVARFGKDRIVRAIKLRAAAPNRIVVHTPERTPASVEG